MNVTFAPSTNASTNGVALGADSNRDVVVWQVVVGTPVASGNIWLRTITNPLSLSTANIAFKTTLPSFSTTNINPGVYTFNFDKGLPLNQGGNLEIDQTMNVTVVWDYLDEVDQ